MEYLETKFKKEFPKLQVKFNEPLSHYSYTKTGGPAEILAFPQTIEEVKKLVQYSKKSNIPLRVLGNASNLIVREGGMAGIVVILTDLNRIEVLGNRVVAQGGASLIETSRLAAAHRLTGLEFACGIPGSMGGAIYMNAGAYGGEMSQIVESVDVITKAGEHKLIKREKLDFAYRHCVIQETGDIVVAVTIALEYGEQVHIDQTIRTLTDLRESRQPLDMPSCGSVFKRPEGIFPAELIEKAGLKGFTIGGAQVSTKHAGFIVNVGGGTASDYLAVINHVKAVVKERFDIELEPEVLVIGREA